MAALVPVLGALGANSLSAQRNCSGTAAAQPRLAPPPQQQLFLSLPAARARLARRRAAPLAAQARAAGEAASPLPPPTDDTQHLAAVAKRVASFARQLKRSSWLGFWSQLTLSVVSAVIIVFSVLFKGVAKARPPRPPQGTAAHARRAQGTEAGLYFILFGNVCAFLSVFWTLGYRRLGERLRRGAEQPELAPPRSQVVNSLTSGVTINMVGMGFCVVGLQATTGLLFAKTLSVAAQNPYLSGATYNPVLALDIFLVQAAANALLSHFVGAALSLWLLKSVTRDP